MLYLIGLNNWRDGQSTVTAKYNLSRQNKICHGKIQFETAHSNYSQQTANTHDKNKNNYCNSKFIMARTKHSREKQNTHGKSKTLTAKLNQEWWSAVAQVRGVAPHNPGLFSMMSILEVQNNVLLQLCINLADKFCTSCGKEKFGEICWGF